MTDLPEHPRLPPQPAPDLAGAVDRLGHEFAGVFASETVAACLADSHARLGEARIKLYQPLLAYRFARERLEASAKVARLLHPLAPEVLFVCTRNSGRSQLAAALLAHRAQGRVSVRSAGTDPAPEVDPRVLAALDSAGVPAGSAFPKPLVPESIEAADVVVTMGCGDACPVMPGPRYLDWDLPAHADPALVLDLLRPLVDDLLAGLSDPAPVKEATT